MLQVGATGIEVVVEEKEEEEEYMLSPSTLN
jgi:hypothetical protein